MDFSGNQNKPNTKVSKKPDLNSFKNDLALGLPTLDKILELSSRVSPLLLIELLSILVKKKPYYKMVFTKEAKLKKKINSNIGE